MFQGTKCCQSDPNHGFWLCVYSITSLENYGLGDTSFEICGEIVSLIRTQVKWGAVVGAGKSECTEANFLANLSMSMMRDRIIVSLIGCTPVSGRESVCLESSVFCDPLLFSNEGILFHNPFLNLKCFC